MIFAIINNRGAFGAYESLPTLMRGAVVVALTETSSNILEVIKNNYEVRMERRASDMRNANVKC